MTYEKANAVTVSLNALKSGTVDFSTLEDAFGPDSLGIILISGLPEKFASLRRRLLSQASHLGNLSAAELESLECAEAKYLVGWSCGKEKLSKERVDTLKGSYYVNCAFYKDSSLSGADGGYEDFPEYTKGNIWPKEEGALEGFRETFQELVTLVIDTAGLVARACDRYAQKHIENYQPGYLEHVVKTSTTTKARLLHYFPPSSSNDDDLNQDQDDTDLDSWCGTHIDHGCLTGLTSAMYIDETTLSSTSKDLTELPGPPDPDAGLYIKNRKGNTVKISIPRDCLAFQTGEALELITSGKFKAVPHFVRGCRASRGAGVARNTIAVFTQPNLYEKVGETDFAGFARGIVDRNTSKG